MHNNDRQTVLIIDDKPTNLSLAMEFLGSQGLDIMLAKSGENGLEKARLKRPDLILLDVMMPGLDGYETCHRLKSDEATRDIPIIFMTALTDLEEKLKAFAVGGVDYITKPFQEPELLARVSVHLKISRLNNELAEKSARLEAALDTSNVVNVAIGIIMRHHYLPRSEAFELIRNRARSRRSKVQVIAEEILAGLDALDMRCDKENR